MKSLLTCLLILLGLYSLGEDDLGAVNMRNKDCNYFFLKKDNKYTLVQHILGEEFKNWTDVYGKIDSVGTFTIHNSKNETELISVSVINMERKAAIKLFNSKCNREVRGDRD